MNIDVYELKYFYDHYKPLEKHFETALIIQARNKYLTEEEKKTVRLQSSKGIIKSEVIQRWSWPNFLAKVLSFNTPEGSYITKNDEVIPNHVLALYFMYNPRHYVDAALTAENELHDRINNFISSGKNGFSEEAVDALHVIPNLSKSAVMKTTPEKVYADIDIDVKEKTAEFETTLKAEVNRICGYTILGTGYEPMVIASSGGYHVLLPIQMYANMKKNKDYFFSPKSLGRNVNDNIEEMVENTHDFIPIPGTERNNFMVKVLWKGEHYGQ